MLEIIPAGAYLDATDLTVTSFSRAAFEMDFAEFGFEDLPIGMQKSQAASFSFKWNNLPSGLQELLLTPQYTTYADKEVTTLFTFYNDEGTSTLRLQYVGAQSNKLGNKFDMIGSDIVGDVQIETVDLLKTILDMETLMYARQLGVDTDGIVDTLGNATYQYPRNFIIDFIDDAHVKSDIMPGARNEMLFYSIADFRDLLSEQILDLLGHWTRSGFVGSAYEASVPNTGYPNTSLTLYDQYQSPVHNSGTALDETDTLILGHVIDANYTSLGGFFSTDKEGAAEFDSLSSFLHALCENFVCKLKYLPIIQNNAFSGKDLITYDLFWLKPIASMGATLITSPKILNNKLSIETAANVFLTAESEIPNMGGGNVNQNRVSLTVSDKTDTWNTKTILHNLPTETSDLETIGGIHLNPDIASGEPKIYPRKLYSVVNFGQETIAKIHEHVVINDGVNTHTLDASPNAMPGANNWNTNTINAWVTATQLAYGLPQAIAEYITIYWSSRDQCLREFTCEMVAGDADGSIMPRHVGDRFTLPALTSVGVGTDSVFLSVKPDWDLGVMDCKFLSLA